MWTNYTLPPFDNDSGFNSNEKSIGIDNEAKSLGWSIFIACFLVGGLGVCFALVREYLKNLRRTNDIVSARRGRTSRTLPRAEPTAPQGNGLIQDMSPTQRKEYVLKVLSIQQYKATQQHSPNEDGDEISSSSSSSSSSDTDEEEAVAREHSVRSCAICLEAFNPYDTVCTSNNEECDHVFHHDCALEWLLKNEDCPCCRRPYLRVVDAEV